MSSSACNGEAESNMKIYLMVMLMSALLVAIRFTTAPNSSRIRPPTRCFFRKQAPAPAPSLMSRAVTLLAAPVPSPNDRATALCTGDSRRGTKLRLSKLAR
jgi:hypothetical protein